MDFKKLPSGSFNFCIVEKIDVSENALLGTVGSHQLSSHMCDCKTRKTRTSISISPSLFFRFNWNEVKNCHHKAF